MVGKFLGGFILTIKYIVLKMENNWVFMQQSLKVVQTKMNNIISILDIIFFVKHLLIDRKTSIQIFYLKHCLKTYEK